MVVAVVAALSATPRVMVAEVAPVSSVSVVLDTLSPATGAEWLARGHSLYAATRYREAVAAFERGLQLRVEGASTAAWNVARSYAQLGNRKQAMRWLTIARELGFRDERAIRDESAFDRFRGDPGLSGTVSRSECSRCRAQQLVTVLM